MKSVLLVAVLLIAAGLSVYVMPPDVRRIVFTRRHATIASVVLLVVVLLFAIAAAQSGLSFQLF